MASQVTLMDMTNDQIYIPPTGTEGRRQRRCFIEVSTISGNYTTNTDLPLIDKLAP